MHETVQIVAKGRRQGGVSRLGPGACQPGAADILRANLCRRMCSGRSAFWTSLLGGAWDTRGRDLALRAHSAFFFASDRAIFSAPPLNLPGDPHSPHVILARRRCFSACQQRCEHRRCFSASHQRCLHFLHCSRESDHRTSAHSCRNDGWGWMSQVT